MESNKDKIIQKLKDAYYFVEDKYYFILDKIDRIVPVYKIVDPIDKVVPSLPLFFFSVLLVVSFAVFFVQPQEKFSTTIKVLDASEKKALQEANIRLEIDGKAYELITDETGKAVLELTGKETSASADIEKLGFEKATKNIVLKAGEVIEILLTKQTMPENQSKKIVFKDSETNEKIIGKISASFSCSARGNPPATKSTENSEMTVSYLASCGTIYATSFAEGYEKSSNVALTEETTEIRLSKIENVGRINVSVLDQESAPVSEVKLRLLDSDGTKLDETLTDSSGTANFSKVKPGSYSIGALHSDGRNATQQDIEVEAEKVSEVRITLENIVAGKKISLKIVDAETKEAIANVEVTVYADKNFLEQLITEYSGKASLAVQDGKQYSALIWHQSYVVKALPTIGLIEAANSAEQTIELEKVKENSSNFATANVSVTDYDTKKPVEEADVLLLNKDYDWMPIRYPSQQTNKDGNSLFPNLPTGNYFAKAKKDDSEGTSAQKTIALGTTVDLNIALVLQSGDFEITVTDYNNNSISDASVSLFDAATKKLIETAKTDSKGKAKSPPIKSDKLVYVKIKKDNYLTFISSVRKVVPKSTQRIDAKLIDSASAQKEKDITIRFRGFYTDPALTKKETMLQSGKNGTKYYLRFEIILPKNASYTDMTKHFRVNGNEQVSLPDTNYTAKILNTEASPERTITLSSCFDPANNYNNPSDCSDTKNGAKQANVYWQTNDGQTTIEETAMVFIEPELVNGTEVKFYYRAKARIADVGFETTEFTKLFRVGDRVCESECPNFIWLFSLQQNKKTESLLSNGKVAPTELASSTDYNLQYSIINTKETDYDANLTAENNKPENAITLNDANGAISIAQFKLNSMGETNKGSPIKLKAKDPVTFTQIDFNLNTVPKSEDNSVSLFFKILADGKLAFSGLPKNLDPRIPNQELSGTIIDKNSLLPIANAVFRVFKDNEKKPVGTGFTDANGFFKQTIQIAAIDSVTVEAEKPTFASAKEKIPVLETSYNQNFECITVDKSTLNVLPKQTAEIKIITTKCAENIELLLSTELKTNNDSATMGQTDESLFKITADKRNTGASDVVQGEYPVYVKARFASENRFVNVMIVSVKVYNQASCLRLSKTVFDFSKQQTDSAVVINSCPTKIPVQNSFRPFIDIDSAKVALSYKGNVLQDTISFNWKTKIRASGKELVYQGDQNIENWKQTAIDTGDDQETNFLGTVKTAIEDANRATKIRFESYYPNECTDSSKLGFIADNDIAIKIRHSTTKKVVVPCTATGCTWKENTCESNPDKCMGIMQNCQHSYFEVELPTEMDIESITARVSNPQNKNFVMYTILSKRKIIGVTKLEDTVVEIESPKKQGIISAIENKETYIGDVNWLTKNLYANPAYKKGFPYDINVWAENDSQGNIETWIVRDSVFAKYVGTKSNAESNIDFSLKNINVNTVDYATITVQDYTSEVK